MRRGEPLTTPQADCWKTARIYFDDFRLPRLIRVYAHTNKQDNDHQVFFGCTPQSSSQAYSRKWNHQPIIQSKLSYNKWKNIPSILQIRKWLLVHPNYNSGLTLLLPYWINWVITLLPTWTPIEFQSNPLKSHYQSIKISLPIHENPKVHIHERPPNPRITLI